MENTQRKQITQEEIEESRLAAALYVKMFFQSMEDAQQSGKVWTKDPENQIFLEALQETAGIAPNTNLARVFIAFKMGVDAGITFVTSLDQRDPDKG